MKQFKNQPVNSDLQPFIQTRTYFIFMKWSQPDDSCLLTWKGLLQLSHFSSDSLRAMTVLYSFCFNAIFFFIIIRLDERTVGGPIKTCVVGVLSTTLDC